MLATILLGPVAGALGGWLGALPFRAVLVHRSAGLGIGVVISVIVVNLGVRFPWANFPGLSLIGPSLLDPFLFGLLGAAGVGGTLAMAQRVLSAETGNSTPQRATSSDGLALGNNPDSIFISYRRSDSLDVTGRIYDRLVQHLGRGRLCRDFDSIPPGVDFRTHIEGLLKRCSTCLVIIGPLWASIKDASGNPRLADPTDHVRQEIENALSKGIKVIPLLVSAAEMPSANELPLSLSALCYRNALKIRPDPDFHRDMDRLLAELLPNSP